MKIYTTNQIVRDKSVNIVVAAGAATVISRTANIEAIKLPPGRLILFSDQVFCEEALNDQCFFRQG